MSNLKYHRELTIKHVAVTLSDGSLIILHPQNKMVTVIDSFGASRGSFAKLEKEINAELAKRKKSRDIE